MKQAIVNLNNVKRVRIIGSELVQKLLVAGCLSQKVREVTFWLRHPLSAIRFSVHSRKIKIK